MNVFVALALWIIIGYAIFFLILYVFCYFVERSVKKRKSEWDKMIERVCQRRYWNPCKEYQVQDVEYEDVSNQKLIEKRSEL